MSIEITTATHETLSSIRQALEESYNTAQSLSSTVPFIGNNSASGVFSVILGGNNNTASGAYSVIVGGQNNNSDNQTNTFILGSNITAGSPNYTYVNNLSTNGIVETANGNSIIWQSTFNTVDSLSASWTEAYTSWSTTSATSIVSFNDTRFSKLSSQAYILVDTTSSIQPVRGSNTASGCYSTVGGGCYNTASGYYNEDSCTYWGATTVGGGWCNNASCRFSNIAGGLCNAACGDSSNVAGGRGNTASSYGSNVAGGRGNTASGCHSNVAGGKNNTASGYYSFIAGGQSNNTNSLSNTFILGSNITAPLADYTYVNNLSSRGQISGQSLTVVGDISATGNVYGNSYINIQSGTTYTITNNDAGGIVGSTNATTGLTASIANTNYPTGFQLSLIQLGTARVTVSAGPGVTLNQADGYYRTLKQYSAATLVNTGATGWVLFGSLNS
jgi:hypothetical protein